MKTTKLSPLEVLAHRIDKHLKRFEGDPDINAPFDGKKGGLCPYYRAAACRSGAYVGICYVSYQGRAHLPRAEAERYANALDGGFIGTHFSLKRTATNA